MLYLQNYLRNKSTGRFKFISSILTHLFHWKPLTYTTILLLILDLVYYQFHTSASLWDLVVLAVYGYLAIGWGIIIYSKLPKKYLAVKLLLSLAVLYFLNNLSVHVNRLISNILSIAVLGLIVTVFIIIIDLIIYLQEYLWKKLDHQDFKKLIIQAVPSLLILCVVLLLYTDISGRLGNIEKKLGGKQSLSCDEQKAIENTKKATVRIVGGLMQGTGIIVRKNGLVVTNYHVVATEPSPKIILSDYSFRTGYPVFLDKNADIAILKMDGENFETINIGKTANLKLLESIFIIGYPMGTYLKGDSTVSSGKFVAWRTLTNSPVGYIQVDAAINEGNSGGPVITSCGELIGMATSGLPGMGLAIIPESITDKLKPFEDSSKPLPKVEVVKLEPEKGPKEVVEAFYTYIKMRQFEKAYELMSTIKINNASIEQFKGGYGNTIDVTLVDIHLKEDKENTVFVKLRSMDWELNDVVYKYYEGEQAVIKENGKWRLNESEIVEIKNPGWEWFMLKTDN